jgi:ABC-type multidrug transport system ATPase subunit
MIYLFIGQPGSGKTTMAKLLVEKLGPDTVWIDGDDLREIFPNTDYSYSGRIRNIEKSFTIARFMSVKGNNVVISMVCPYRAIRDDLKANNEVKEVLFTRDHFSGRDKFHVKNFESPVENYIDFRNGESLQSSFEELLILLKL